jgi:hypothetical protein
MDGRFNSSTGRGGQGGAGSSALARAVALLKSIGPYAALELVLPGGSLLALLLWLYRHRSGALFAPRALLQSQHISGC